MPKARTVMQIQTHLSQRGEPGLLLVPKMLQSIGVLQLATVELASLIEQELAQNETLEMQADESEDMAGPEDDGPSDDDPSDGDEWDIGRRVPRDGDDPKLALLANVPATTDRLMQHVREQLAWLDLPPPLGEKVLALAERLDDRGFLLGTDEELLAAVRGQMLEEAMAALRSLDPKGIGARDVIDALLMQVSPRDPDYSDIGDMLTCHLEALARNKIPEVARRMGRPVAEVQALLDRIRELDPHPGLRFCDEVAQAVRPDLVVFCQDGELQISVNDGDLPSLRLNEDYAAMVRASHVETEVKQYLRPKIDSSRSLIYAIEQRRKTLARVGYAVMEHQKGFLQHGRAAIRPLKMAEIAAVLDLHTSTVSRAVAGKYVQTDRGIYLLRDFFDGARNARNGSQEPGRLGIQERIRELVAGEEPGRPLSDDDLVALLASNEISVARRTVTKYRKELGIPSSWRRRRYPT